MTDTVMKLLALAGLIVTLGTLAWYVPEWNLVLVLTIAAAMAVYDFFFHRRKPRNSNDDKAL